jgi:hypothetical protein
MIGLWSYEGAMHIPAPRGRSLPWRTAADHLARLSPPAGLRQRLVFYPLWRYCLKHMLRGWE